MTVCLDTNVILQAIDPEHEFHPILDAVIDGRMALAVSTDVLLEYEEVITRMAGAGRWRKFARLLDLAGLTGGNIIHITPWFHFRTIESDRDDDIFADCAIAADAEWIVTEDRHFNALLGSGYRPQPIKPHEFIRRFLATT